MAIANPRIHIICGICGSNKFFKYEICKELDDDTNKKVDVVYLICDNCSSLTSLDELMKKEKKEKKKN